jgi:hypothetical protein
MNDPTLEKQIMMDCPDCDGDGEMFSDCCGVPGRSNGDSCTEDFGICPECGDHCTYSPCDTCGGTGEVEMNEDELQEMKDNIEFEHET